MNPIRRRPCADPGQKQVPGERMTQKGIDFEARYRRSRACSVESTRVSHHKYTEKHPAFPAQWF